MAAGGCVGPGDGHGSCRKQSCSAGQSHGKLMTLLVWFSEDHNGPWLTLNHCLLNNNLFA